MKALEHLAAKNSRDATAVARSVGLTTLVGSNEKDLRRHWSGLRQWVPGGYLDAVSFETWRQRGLVGTPDEVRHRVQKWHDLGVNHIVCALGIPFGVWDEEQLEILSSGL